MTFEDVVYYVRDHRKERREPPPLTLSYEDARELQDDLRKTRKGIYDEKVFASDYVAAWDGTDPMALNGTMLAGVTLKVKAP